MGDRLKYSSCIFPPGVGDDDINAAEVAALLQVEQRAKLEDGQDILELGCGGIYRYKISLLHSTALFCSVASIFTFA
jgi:cyclopropane fatty-acyl-phospholipid synthase-like methyltransferase